MINLDEVLRLTKNGKLVWKKVKDNEKKIEYQTEYKKESGVYIICLLIRRYKLLWLKGDVPALVIGWNNWEDDEVYDGFISKDIMIELIALEKLIKLQLNSS